MRLRSLPGSLLFDSLVDFILDECRQQGAQSDAENADESATIAQTR